MHAFTKAGNNADQAAYEAKLEKTRPNFTPDSQVLEFGCGTGTTALPAPITVFATYALHHSRIRPISLSTAARRLPPPRLHRKF